jgi:hypothetical protein
MAKLKPLTKRCADNYCKTPVAPISNNLCYRHERKRDRIIRRKALFKSTSNNTTSLSNPKFSQAILRERGIDE